MKEIQYKDFSLSTHKKNWRIRKPNVCQFELTFRCDFHCLYCYSDCYNNPTDTKKELSTSQVKQILDKVYKAGCLWLCLTGGDPLKREDFLEIYDYAKQKGFIITIFTNGYSLTEKIADFLEAKPPFVIEITLNSVTKETFEEISQLPDSHEKTFDNLAMLIKRKIPIKIKTMITKNNVGEIPGIEKFVRGLGLEFQATSFIYGRLNKDSSPCALRVTPQEAFVLNGGRLEATNKQGNDCFSMRQNNTNAKDKNHNKYLFRCAAGEGDGIHISPHGKMFFCSFLREPSIGILEQDEQEGLFKLFPSIKEKVFISDSPCRTCKIRYSCYSCPGSAFVEKSDMEAPIDWFCELAHLQAKEIKR